MPILNIKPHPFKKQRLQAEIPEGCTLHQLLPKDRSYFNVHVNGRSFDDLTPLGTDDIVDIALTPKGGSREETGSKALQAGLTILSTALVTFATGGNFVAGLKAGSIIAGLQLAGGAIAPNPSLGKPQEFERLGSLTGSRNQMKPYNVIPKVYGHRKIFPPIAGKPFTEIVGSDQYLRILFCLGYGPMEVHSPKIGDTVIGTIDHTSNANTFTPNSNYEDVEAEIGLTPALYAKDVNQSVPGGVLEAANDTQTQTTAVDTDEISIDLTFENGLYKNNNGKTQSAGFLANVEFRETGTSTWLNALDAAYSPQYVNCKQGTSVTDAINAVNSARETQRIGFRFKPPSPGQYDVRITRVNNQDANEQSTATWSALKSISYETPTNTENIVYMALRVKASKDIQGVLDNFSVEVKSKLPTYDGSTWTLPTVNSSGNGTGTVSSNPAWVVADIMMGNANSGALDSSRLDAAAFKAWADNCTTENRECNLVVDSGITVHDLIKEAASYGYADVNIVDGIYTVIEDKAVSTPVQHFTPRNTMNFSASRVFPDVPHALKVRFINPTKDWQQDEAIVYDDNYSEDGTGCLFGSGTCKTATKFETVEYLGITSWDQAWKTGRYMLAEMRLRPEIYTLDVDFEHLIANRGDLVKVTHDVPLWGSGYGRVKAVTRNASNEITSVTLDDVVTIDGTSNYVLRVRGDDGTSHELTVAAMSAGEYNEIDITPEVAAIAAGDLYMFGELGSETTNLKVASIEAKNDLEATLTLVDDAPEIYTADDGTIPAFDSNLTEPVDLSSLTPPDPVINDIRSDTQVLYQDNDRSKRLSMVIDFSVAKGFPSLQVEAQARVSGSTGSWRLTEIVDASDGVVSLINVEQGQEYEVRIRAKNNNKVSNWVETTHTVVGKGEAPSDVTGYVVTVDKAQIRHNWVENTDTDIEEYEIRIGGTGWADATFVDRTKGTTITTPIPGSGGFTYRIKAIDTSGNYSSMAASDTVTVDSKYTSDPSYPDDVGTTVQAWDAQLDTLSALTQAEADAMVAVSEQQYLWLGAADQAWGTTDDVRFNNLEITGTINYVNETNLQVEDKTITVNKNGTDGSAVGAGLIVERVSANKSFLWQSDYWDAGASAVRANAFEVGTTGHGFDSSGNVSALTAEIINGLSSATRPVGSELWVESSGDVRIAIGTPNTSRAGLTFVDPEGSASEFLYYHDSNQFEFRIGGLVASLSSTIFDLDTQLLVNSKGVNKVADFSSTDQFAQIFLSDNTTTNGELFRRNGDILGIYTGGVEAINLDATGNATFSGDLTAEANLLSGAYDNDTWAGNGYRGTNDGDWVVDSLRVRNSLSVYEFVAKQISSVGGKEILSIGNGRIESINTGASTVVIQDVRGQGASSFKAGDKWEVQVSDINNDLESGGTGAVVRSAHGTISSVTGTTLTLSFDSGVIGDLQENDLMVLYGSSDTARNAIMYRNVDRSDDYLITRVQTGVTSRAALTAIGNTRFAYGDVSAYWNDSTGESKSDVFGSFAGDINSSHWLATDQGVRGVGIDLDVTSYPRVSDEGLETLLRFNGSSIDGTGNYTTTESNVLWNNTAVSGQSLDLRGADNEYVSISSYSGLTGESDFSITFSFLQRNFSAKADHVLLRLGSTNIVIWVRSNNKLQFWVRNSADSAWQSISSTTTLTNFTYYTATCKLDSGTMSITLNGVEEATLGSVTINTTTSELQLGNDPTTTGRGWDGLIDELRIYTRATSKQEDKSLYLYPSGNSGGLISANTVRTGELLSANVSGGSDGAFTTAGFRANLDEGWISAPAFALGTTQSRIAGSYFDDLAIWGGATAKADATLRFDFENQRIRIGSDNSQEANLTGAGIYGANWLIDNQNWKHPSLGFNVMGFESIASFGTNNTASLLTSEWTALQTGNGTQASVVIRKMYRHKYGVSKLVFIGNAKVDPGNAAGVGAGEVKVSAGGGSVTMSIPTTTYNEITGEVDVSGLTAGDDYVVTVSVQAELSGAGGSDTYESFLRSDFTLDAVID